MAANFGRGRGSGRMTRGRRTFTRRKKIMVKDGHADSLVTGNSSIRDALAVFETAYGADLLGCTVAGGYLDVGASLSGTTGNTPGQLTIGLRKYTQSQLANIGNSGGPSTDPNADWFVYEPILVPADGTFVTYHKKIGSGRKLDELGESILVTAEAVQADGTMDFRYALTLVVLMP